MMKFVSTRKKRDLFALATGMFGEWRTWGRAEHIAYGLARGVEYRRMERYSNDNPHSVLWLSRLVALLEIAKPAYCSPQHVEMEALVEWVRKPSRITRKSEVEQQVGTGTS